MHPQVNKLFKATTDLIRVVRNFGLDTNESGYDKLHNKFLATKQFTPNHNRIRNSINDVFDEKTCFYVHVAISDGIAGLSYEKALQSIDTISYEDLQAECRTAMEEISTHVLNYIQVKKVEETPMNAALFCEYSKQIVPYIIRKRLFKFFPSKLLEV